MRNLTVLLLTLTLTGALAVAQAHPRTPARNSQQQNSSQQNAQTPMTAPRTTTGDRNASQVDRGVPADQNSAAAGTQDTAPATSPQQTPADRTATPQRANTGGSGVPWGWIIIGIVVIAIILALIGRGSNDRALRRDDERDLGVRPIDDTERRDDDIRRAS